MIRNNFTDAEVALAYGAHSKAQEDAARDTWLGDQQFIDQFVALAPKGGRVLDAGAGSGNQAQYFSERGLNVTMTEGSLGMLEIARRNAPAAEGCVAVLPEIPFAEGQFDGVFSRHVLHHLSPPNVEASIRSIRRVMKDKGYFGLIMPVSSSQSTEEQWWNIADQDYVRINRYPRQMLDDILLHLGFTTVISEVVYEENVSVLRTIVRKDVAPSF